MGELGIAPLIPQIQSTQSIHTPGPHPGLSHCDTRVTVTSGSFIVIPALNTALGRSFFLGNVFSGS